MKSKILNLFLVCTGSLLLMVHSAFALGSAFTYQGLIEMNGSAVTATYPFTFSLFNAITNGSMLASSITQSNVSVVGGHFSATLDFGIGVFNGTNVWLEVSVSTNNGTSFMTFVPREQITPAPYTLYAATAAGLANGVGLGSALSNSIANVANLNSFIGGGGFNTIGFGSVYASIPGGYDNVIQSAYSVIGGGYANSIQSNALYSAIAGGSNNYASGSEAMIPGGDQNVVEGVDSFAAGHRAKAYSPGMFVWADTLEQDFNPNSYGFYINSFNVRATGGAVWITSTNGATGPFFIPGDLAWRSSCDRNLKENFQPVDRLALLQKLTSLPITQWNAKAQDANIQHIGPVAQDFHAAFGLGGNDDKSISSIDEDGVALAAIQGLNEKVEEQNSELKKQVAEQARQLQARDAAIASLQQRLEQIEKKISRPSTQP